MKEQWQGFKGSKWKDEVDVRDFIQNNYKPYNGDESFLEGPKESTNTLWVSFKNYKRRTCQRRCIRYGNRSGFESNCLWPWIFR